MPDHQTDNRRTQPGARLEGSFYIEIFLVSFAGILLEIAYTRIFSFKLYYYFTYVTLGVALLGLGSGGVIVSIFSALRGIEPRRLVSFASIAGSAAVAAGYFVSAGVQLNAWQLPAWSELGKLVLLVSLLFLPFLSIGIVIAVIFASRVSDINRLYFADLLGAASACALALPAMILLSPPGTVFLAGAALATNALLATEHQRRFVRSTAAMVMLASVTLALLGARLPDPVPDAAKTLSPQRRGKTPPLFTQWHPVFRVDVVDWDWLKQNQRYGVVHDGMLGSVMLRFDGDMTKLSTFQRDLRALPFEFVAPGPKVAIIGSAGGHEILTSLYFGAREIVGVELNPVTVSLLRGPFADFTGHIAFDPRVTLVNAEGRSFLSGTSEKYDVIWFVAPDSYAAMNAAASGAFVLAESYLYTTEMIVTALHRLRPGGLIVTNFGEIDFERKPNRTARYLSSARAALNRAGLSEGLERRFLVVSSRGYFNPTAILIRREPFTASEADKLSQWVSRLKSGKVRYAPGGPTNHRVLERILTTDEQGFRAFLQAYPYDVSPVYDDRPFFWHFARFKDVLSTGRSHAATGFDPEIGVGEKALLTLLVVCTLLAALWLLLPFFWIRSIWRSLPHKAATAVYFGALGVGFMGYEIVFMQKLTLLLGYPTYSLTVTLASLLLFTGLGSWLAGVVEFHPQRMLLVAVSGLVLTTIVLQVVTPPLIADLSARSAPIRALIAMTLLAPLGVCLGVFMPTGLRVVSSLTTHSREYAAWAWAVNGFFSVLGSVSATIFAMAWGFRLTLMFALTLYLVGVLCVTHIARQRTLP